MIKLIAGKFGPKLLGPGTILNLDSKDEKRLVDSKVAVYVNSGKQDSDEDEFEGNGSDDLELKTVEQLNKIRAKKDLIEYAESIGLHDLNEADSKESLVAAIVNYQEENFEE
jgi:hypothetical protein